VQFGKELHHHTSPQLLAHNNIALLINSVHLEDMLRQVQPDRANFVHGRLLSCGVHQRPRFGTSMP
jgi:hypothetical protein